MCMYNIHTLIPRHTTTTADRTCGFAPAPAPEAASPFFRAGWSFLVTRKWCWWAELCVFAYFACAVLFG